MSNPVHSVRVYRYEDGDEITIIRTFWNGVRQVADINSVLTQVVHHEDGWIVIDLPQRQQIVDDFNKVAERWNVQGSGNMKWDNIEPVYGSEAWEDANK